MGRRASREASSSARLKGFALQPLLEAQERRAGIAGAVGVSRQRRDFATAQLFSAANRLPQSFDLGTVEQTPIAECELRVGERANPTAM
jgi:hypothetical protein